VTSIVCFVGCVFFLYIAIKPMCADIYFKRSMTCKKERAVYYVKKAIRWFPPVEQYHVRLGNLYKNLAENGDKKQTIRYLKLAENEYRYNAEKFKGQPANLCNLGICYMWQAQMAGLSTTDKAIENFQSALKINHYFVPGWHNLGKIYGWLGKYDSAIKCYRRVLEIKPNLVNVLYSMGYVYAQMGDREKTVKCWKKVLEIKPDYERALTRLKQLGVKVNEKE